MKRIESGPLPKQHPVEELFKGRVIKRESKTRDTDINELIQAVGAHCDGAGSEAAWYRKHKGYSEKL